LPRESRISRAWIFAMWVMFVFQNAKYEVNH
jgi:hypothetical protein